MNETFGMRGGRIVLSAVLITIATLALLAAILVIIRAPTTLVWELEILGREEGPALAVVALFGCGAGASRPARVQGICWLPSRSPFRSIPRPGSESCSRT